ncbi:hypothetical protein AAFF_G00111210 [Aldrovandia affinis]|uniref:Uncharacterized protein n=1 Tax=Aldrovandia affinis TaxID=143900 RepID=A0AAD7RTK1_9TELE|nr:hypothetical protein AAFF_G00111210 [Aldrovandia affinis]
MEGVPARYQSEHVSAFQSDVGTSTLPTSLRSLTINKMRHEQQPDEVWAACDIASRHTHHTAAAATCQIAQAAGDWASFAIGWATSGEKAGCC